MWNRGARDVGQKADGDALCDTQTMYRPSATSATLENLALLGQRESVEGAAGASQEGPFFFSFCVCFCLSLVCFAL